MPQRLKELPLQEIESMINAELNIGTLEIMRETYVQALSGNKTNECMVDRATKIKKLLDKRIETLT